MNNSLRLIGLAATLTAACHAQADSFASSASSAGSKSSGSISDSLNGSSNSSSDDKKKVANGAYRIIDVAATPGRDNMTRITMQAEAQQRIVLDLPKATFDQHQLAQGGMVYAQNRAYGIEFARDDTRKAFFLVLADQWYGELAARPVGI